MLVLIDERDWPTEKRTVVPIWPAAKGRRRRRRRPVYYLDIDMQPVTLDLRVAPLRPSQARAALHEPASYGASRRPGRDRRAKARQDGRLEITKSFLFLFFSRYRVVAVVVAAAFFFAVCGARSIFNSRSIVGAAGAGAAPKLVVGGSNAVGGGREE